MNKLYSQIASLLVIVGLVTAWAFNVINETSFGTISVVLLSAIYALYQKYEKDEVVTNNMKLEDKINELELFKKESQSFLKDDKSYIIGMDPIESKPKRIRKPKVK